MYLNNSGDLLNFGPVKRGSDVTSFVSFSISSLLPIYNLEQYLEDFLS